MVSVRFCAGVPNFLMEIEVDDVPCNGELVTHVPVIEDGGSCCPIDQGGPPR